MMIASCFHAPNRGKPQVYADPSKQPIRYLRVTARFHTTGRRGHPIFMMISLAHIIQVATGAAPRITIIVIIIRGMVRVDG